MGSMDEMIQLVVVAGAMQSANKSLNFISTLLSSSIVDCIKWRLIVDLVKMDQISPKCLTCCS